MKFLTPLVSLMLTPLVACLPLQAEIPGGVAAPAVAGTSTPKLESKTLTIRLADAANAVVEANSTQTGYSIVVSDSAGLPVSDAAVAVRLPEEGPTGYFMNGVHSSVSYTNAAGLAKFAQVNWGPALGVATIMVTVVKGDLHAGALLEETIVLHLAQGNPARPAAIVPKDKSAGTSLAAAPLPATPPPTPIAGKPAPGTPASVAEIKTHAGLEKTMPLATTTATSQTPEPVVSVENAPATTGGSRAGSNKKWLVVGLVAVAVGIGAGVALGLSGKAAVAAASSTTGVSIGSPSVSVGH